MHRNKGTTLHLLNARLSILGTGNAWRRYSNESFTCLSVNTMATTTRTRSTKRQLLPPAKLDAAIWSGDCLLVCLSNIGDACDSAAVVI